MVSSMCARRLMAGVRHRLLRNLDENNTGVASEPSAAGCAVCSTETTTVRALKAGVKREVCLSGYGEK